MKKLILLTTVTFGASMAAYSQGVLNFTDVTTPGYVVENMYGYNSSTVNPNYQASPDFTIQLWAISGNPTDTSGLPYKPDSYGYLTVSRFLADGFNLVGTTLGGSVNGISVGGGDGYFQGGTTTVSGSPGSSDGTVGTVLALVAWTGHTETTLSQAIASGEWYGIMAFWNPLGPGGLSVYIPGLDAGWPATASPASIANEPPGYPQLVLSPVVPEPATFALMGLGSLSLLLFRRRK